MKDVVFSTNGQGYWTTKKQNIRIVDIKLGPPIPLGDGHYVSELTVWLHPEDWSFDDGDLVYTDPQFLDDLRNWLKQQGLRSEGVEYSEQGMQGSGDEGENFVSFDVGRNFISSWKRKGMKDPKWMLEFFSPNNY